MPVTENTDLEVLALPQNRRFEVPNAALRSEKESLPGLKGRTRASGRSSAVLRPESRRRLHERPSPLNLATRDDDAAGFPPTHAGRIALPAPLCYPLGN